MPSLSVNHLPNQSLEEFELLMETSLDIFFRPDIEIICFKDYTPHPSKILYINIKYIY